MQIISHRGYWKQANEKNTDTAFERSFSLGFGTETDFRDYMGELVIAHDIANGQAVKAEDFFNLYNKYQDKPLLAINIKADGLQHKLKELIVSAKISNYFVFDMSVPDTIGYMKNGINFYSRQSEYEPHPAFYAECNGIWLDSFLSTWYTNEVIIGHLGNNKNVAIVSAELHQRDHLPLWKQLKEGNLHNQPKLILCTDLPEQAVEFFKD